MKTTRYFDEQALRKRPYLRLDWVEATLANPVERIVQPDGRTWSDPQIIRPGWQLVLPTSGARAAPANGAAVHVVERGDTLSGIAAEELGDPYRYPEIFDLNVGDSQPDGRRLEDPNLILPGWELDLPTEATIGPMPAEPPPVPSCSHTTARASATGLLVPETRSHQDLSMPRVRWSPPCRPR